MNSVNRPIHKKRGGSISRITSPCTSHGCVFFRFQDRLFLIGNRTTCVAALFVATALSACQGGIDDNGNSTSPAPLSCSQLKGMSVPTNAIGLPTTGATVAAASLIPASGTGGSVTPEYCLVSGSISPVDPSAPKINFQIAMPTQWNNKVMMFGGGGYDGTVPAVTGNVPAGPIQQSAPLARGYAVFASDSGHQANALGSRDGSFGTNDEAVANFSGDALKKTHDAVVYLIGKHYAGDKPQRAYFAGGSSGGREALDSLRASLNDAQCVKSVSDRTSASKETRS